MARQRELPGIRGADDARAEYENFHIFLLRLAGHFFIGFCLPHEEIGQVQFLLTHKIAQEDHTPITKVNFMFTEPSQTLKK